MIWTSTLNIGPFCEKTTVWMAMRLRLTIITAIYGT